MGVLLDCRKQSTGIRAVNSLLRFASYSGFGGGSDPISRNRDGEIN